MYECVFVSVLAGRAPIVVVSQTQALSLSLSLPEIPEESRRL